GREVVVPGPTCSYMMKQEWPLLAADRETAGLVAQHTRDLFEYLARLHADGKLDTAFRVRPGSIAYQIPCHLRAQNMGTKSADVGQGGRGSGAGRGSTEPGGSSASTTSCR